MVIIIIQSRCHIKKTTIPFVTTLSQRGTFSGKFWRKAFGLVATMFRAMFRSCFGRVSDDVAKCVDSCFCFVSANFFWTALVACMLSQRHVACMFCPALVACILSSAQVACMLYNVVLWEKKHDAHVKRKALKRHTASDSRSGCTARHACACKAQSAQATGEPKGNPNGNPKGTQREPKKPKGNPKGTQKGIIKN